jgi:hypothetical protein
VGRKISNTTTGASDVEELTNTSFLDVLLTIFPKRLIDNSIKMMI